MYKYTLKYVLKHAFVAPGWIAWTMFPGFFCLFHIFVYSAKGSYLSGKMS